MITYFAIGILIAVLVLFHQKYSYDLTFKEALIEEWWAYPTMILIWPIGAIAYIDIFIITDYIFRPGREMPIEREEEKSKCN